MEERTPDAIFYYGGTVTLARPVTARADEWFADHLPDGPRFGNCWCLTDDEFAPTVRRMEEDGYAVEARNAGDTY